MSRPMLYGLYKGATAFVRQVDAQQGCFRVAFSCRLPPGTVADQVYDPHERETTGTIRQNDPEFRFVQFDDPFPPVDVPLGGESILVAGRPARLGGLLGDRYRIGYDKDVQLAEFCDDVRELPYSMQGLLCRGTPIQMPRPVLYVRYRGLVLRLAQICLEHSDHFGLSIQASQVAGELEGNAFGTLRRYEDGHGWWVTIHKDRPFTDPEFEILFKPANWDDAPRTA